MRFRNKYPNKKNSKLFWFIFLFILVTILSLSYFRVRSFIFSGDTIFIDQRVLKILSLTYLKDSPIFWLDKNLFEQELKTEMPQIKSLNYKVIDSQTIEINIVAEDICCVVKDNSEKKYILNSEGVFVREYSFNDKSEYQIISLKTNQVADRIDPKLITVIKKIINQEVKLEGLQDNNLYLEENTISLKTQDAKKILINENTNLDKFNENYKSLKSHLEQNGKNYSILDFRFEKIIVK